jgi:NAD(P)-dependent dehydrogenase (short-subunit alcohol dehydrogenase family)
MTSTMSWLSFMPILLYSQLLVRIPYPTQSFAGQTIIVTGSNTGLGLEAARHLVRLGASKVILAVRTISKGEAAAENILASTKATKNTVEVWQLDLSDYESIKRFAKRVEGLERLDAVIQNAGILQNHFETIAGEEMHIRVNVIGALLLGLLVLPKLRESAKEFNTRTRLTFVGSDMQYVAVMKEAETQGSILDALNDEEKSDIGDR